MPSFSDFSNFKFDVVAVCNEDKLLLSTSQSIKKSLFLTFKPVVDLLSQASCLVCDTTSYVELMKIDPKFELKRICVIARSSEEGAKMVSPLHWTYPSLDEALEHSGARSEDEVAEVFVFGDDVDMLSECFHDPRCRKIYVYTIHDASSSFNECDCHLPVISEYFAEKFPCGALHHHANTVYEEAIYTRMVRAIELESRCAAGACCPPYC